MTASDRNIHKSWPIAALSVIGGFISIAALFWATVTNAVGLWSSSSAYNHCFLILPITLYLIWDKRQVLAGVVPTPSVWGLPVILLSAAAWFAAFVAGINEGMHFAVVGMLQGLLLAVLGWPVYRLLLFPFLYLWLMVPTGEFLLPGLQSIAAVVSAHALDLSGIPVFRDGVTIQVPTGMYRVAEGCAGLNFLLASLAFALVYAELIYRRWRNRLGFVAFMLAVSIASNIIRIYLIILVAHWTNNQADIVDDHLFYGWAFFALVMLGVMWLGLRFREDSVPDRPAVLDRAVIPAPFWRTALMTAMGIAVAALPAGAAWAKGRGADQPVAQLAPLSCGSWAEAELPSDWSPASPAADRTRRLSCVMGGQKVDMMVVAYNGPVRRAKLPGLSRRAEQEGAWTWIERGKDRLRIGGTDSDVALDRYRSGSRNRLVWSFYWVGGKVTGDSLTAVLADLWQEIASGNRRAAVISFSVEETADMGEMRGRLQAFLDGQPSLDGMLMAALAPAAQR